MSSAEQSRLNASRKTASSHGTFDASSSPLPHPGIQNFHEEEEGERSADRSNGSYTLVGEVRSALLPLWQIKICLIFVPLVFLGKMFNAGDGALFVFSFLSLIPLAALLGDFTEDICKRSNEVIGALINVTFGNATELIISFMALKAGLFQLIKYALIGSILGNMLLVLGTGFLLGGLTRRVLRFNALAANTYTPLLMLSVMSFVIPSGLATFMPHTSTLNRAVYQASVLAVSRQVATVTAVIYLCYLWFQLVTHKDIFDDDSSSVSTESVNGSPDDQQRDEVTAAVATGSSSHDDDDDDDAPLFTLTFAVVGLAVVSVVISYASDVLVDSVQGAAVQLGIPSEFIGLILVPIVGNAAEHATAVIMAQKGRLDVAVGVALGSSIQIALFVMPVLVLGGWAFGIPLDMNFNPYPTALLMVSVLVASMTVSDGRSNWLEGAMLLGAYVMIAVTTLHTNNIILD